MWVSQQDLCKDLLHVAAVHHIVGELDYVAVAQDSLLAGLNLLSIDPAAVTAIGVLEVEPASCVVKMLKTLPASQISSKSPLTRRVQY